MKKIIIFISCFIFSIVNAHSIMWNTDNDDVVILNYFHTDYVIKQFLVEEIICNELPVKDYFEKNVGHPFYLVKKYNSLEDFYESEPVEQWNVKFDKNNVVAFSEGELLVKIFILNDDNTLEIFQCDWEL